MSKKPQTLYQDTSRKIEVDVGGTCRDYRGGDFINALDELVSWFESETELSTDHIAALMDVYAAELRR